MQLHIYMSAPPQYVAAEITLAHFFFGYAYNCIHAYRSLGLQYIIVYIVYIVYTVQHRH